MSVPVVASKPGEYTRVGLETEVKIPFLTYVFTSLVLMIVTTGLWGLLWLLVDKFSRRAGAFWRWFVDNGWRWYVGMLILCWIGLSAAAYLYRLFIEQLAKNTPAYDNLDPYAGIWNPLGRSYEEPDDEPPEMELEMVDVNLTTDGQHGRPQIRRLPRFPSGRNAKQFYRAVAQGAASFSDRGAAKFGISQNVFRQHIRGNDGADGRPASGLIGRGLATWKNERHRNLGVDITPDGMRLLEQLGRGR